MPVLFTHYVRNVFRKFKTTIRIWAVHKPLEFHSARNNVLIAEIFIQIAAFGRRLTKQALSALITCDWMQSYRKQKLNYGQLIF